MNPRKTTVALATLTILVVFPARATSQGAPTATADSTLTRTDVHGRVLSEASHSAIRAANVDLLSGSGASTARLAHVIAGADGNFRIAAVRPGHYRLRVRAIGFTPRELPIVVATGSPSIDVGTLTLATSAVELQAVTVTATKRDVDLAPDRNSYAVRDMPATRGGSALDVLRNVPSVDVDIDNVVSLRGNSGVVVEINGRPSPMKASQLGNFLSQLPADMVSRVEVIPNPSARDDPEGVAGIINIVLEKRTDAMLGGGLTLAGGTTGRAQAGGNLGYQRGPFSSYGSYGFMRDDRPRSSAIDRQNLYLEPMTYLDETSTRTQTPVAHTFTGSVGYNVSERNVLSLDLMYSRRTEAETNSIFYRDLDAARQLTGSSDRFSEGTNREYNFESTLGWEHKYLTPGHKLSAELRTFRGGEGGPSTVSARALELDGAPAGVPSRETQTGWEHPAESALRLDYSRPLSSIMRLEAGYKGALQHFHTTLDTRVFDTTEAAFISDSTRTSDFTYDQLVNAAYGMLDAQAGKLLLQGGLRLERATTQFHLNLRDASYENDYNSIFPSALIAYDFDDAHQVKLSYSTRIRRPDDADMIDPTLHYQDPLNVSRGNPSLKPEYIRSLELGLQRTGPRLTMQLTPFFRHTVNAVRSLSSIDSAGVATRTFANIATTDAWGADATIAMNGSRLRGFAGASAFRQVSNASNVAQDLSARTFGWTARTNTTLRVSNSTDLQALLYYRAPRTVEQGRNSGRTRFSLAARQKMMGDQLNLTLRLIDPFNNSRERSTTNDPRFYQVSDRIRSDRGVILSVSWSFGKQLHDRSDDGERRDVSPSDRDAGS